MPRFQSPCPTRVAAFALALACGAAQAADARRQVIIDQDLFGPGGSNMNSVLMLLQAPDVDVLGIVVSSGDGWREEEIAQTLRMLELVGRPDVPVYAGAAFPLLNSAARMKAWERRYGPLVWKGAWTESFGGTPRADYHADPFLVPPLAAGAPSLKVQAESGIDFMIRAVHQHPGRVTLWMGGALTDLALAVRQDPGFAAATRELVFMGGSFNPVAADNNFADEYAHSPRREFNMLWDAEAASAVLHEAWPRVVQIPVDPTTKTFFGKALYAEIGRAGTPVAALRGALSAKAFRCGTNWPRPCGSIRRWSGAARRCWSTWRPATAPTTAARSAGRSGAARAWANARSRSCRTSTWRASSA